MPATCTPVRVHVTSDRLFAHVFVGEIEICFENNGAKLEPGAFAATAAHTAAAEITPAEIDAAVQESAAAALSTELARLIEVAKPRKLTFAQVQRIYGRAID